MQKFSLKDPNLSPSSELSSQSCSTLADQSSNSPIIKKTLEQLEAKKDLVSADMYHSCKSYLGKASSNVSDSDLYNKAKNSIISEIAKIEAKNDYRGYLDRMESEYSDMGDAAQRASRLAKKALSSEASEIEKVSYHVQKGLMKYADDKARDLRDEVIQHDDK